MEIDGTSQRLSNLPTAWTLGSTCTGTGAFELVSDAVCNALNDALSDKTGTTFVHHEIACEIEKYKQGLLLNVLPGDCCLFSDVTQLKTDEERTCVRHRNKCELPKKLFGFTSGFSCKSLSKLQNAQSLKKALANRDQESSSFKTFAGNLDVLSLSSPLWVILENVDLGSDEGADSNSAMVSEQLASVGYTTRLILLRADQFGLPQRRKRLFIIGINNDRAMEELLDTPEQMLHSVINTFLPAMKVENPPVDAFLLADDDPEVDAERDRRTQVAANREAKKHEVVPTILPSGTVRDVEKSRLHLGREQLALQGIRYQKRVNLSNNQMQDLACGRARPFSAAPPRPSDLLETAQRLPAGNYIAVCVALRLG
ncbi:unnamed protein product [Durusdinium trenchii]|uniref:DNA (cytosine-5-)-methyltransferase n=1 Tax=Durusdinium trenchii TaxID=1381693 RepID=A0ABP0N4S5_9DINO